MPTESKGDRIWLALCAATGVAVDVTLNKYASALPGWVVLCLWGIPMSLFVVWFWRVETTKAWVKHRFLEHPVSYVLMFLILIPFGWQATATMFSKLSPARLTTKPATNAVQQQTIPAAVPPALAKADVPSPRFQTRTQKETNRALPPKGIPSQTAQNSLGGSSIQQSTTGPNSPNVAGNGNQISYSDTSELPLLSQAQIASITNQMAGTKFKVVIRFSMADREANVFADDLVRALKAAGWDADWQAGMGGAMQNSVPIAMGVKDAKNANSSEPNQLLRVVETAVGFQIPAGIESSIPDGEVAIAIMSHPLRRPK